MFTWVREVRMPPLDASQPHAARYFYRLLRQLGRPSFAYFLYCRAVLDCLPSVMGVNCTRTAVDAFVGGGSYVSSECWSLRWPGLYINRYKRKKKRERKNMNNSGWATVHEWFLFKILEIFRPLLEWHDWEPTGSAGLLLPGSSGKATLAGHYSVVWPAIPPPLVPANLTDAIVLPPHLYLWHHHR